MTSNDSSDSDHTLPHSGPPDRSEDTRIAPPEDGGGGPDRTSETTFVLPVPDLPVVPGYIVTREVARGGMSAVYAARDPVFERELAVKVMSPDQDAERFVIEAKVTAGLPHPGVPPVYSLGTTPDGRPFLAMKLIEGRTLAAELNAAGRAEPARLLDVFQHICQTVGFAHARGIVHRDLKPTNVMIGSFGEVLVVDWGLAREARFADRGTRTTPERGAGNPGRGPRSEETDSGGEPPAGSPRAPLSVPGGEPIAAPRSTLDVPTFKQTQAGQVKGTPAYMAPEQARGEPVDARADVFALGGILADVLTGAPPFAGNTIGDTVLMAARAELGTCFAALDACGADGDLIAVAKRCLAARPAERYPTGEAVAAAVAAYRAGVEERLHRAERDRAAAEARAAEEVNTRAEAEARIGAERTSATEQRKRRRAQLVVAAVLVVLVGCAGAFAWWRDKQAGERARADERAAVERARIEAGARAAEARLAGERDAEARTKADQARQGVRSALDLAAGLRKQLKFEPAGAALAQAAALATGGAPELLGEVDRAREALAFAAELDGIRYNKWAWIPEVSGRGTFDLRGAPPKYRRAFARRDLDLAAVTPADAVKRIAASPIRAELVMAVDDWALLEPNPDVRNRLLEIARAVDPGPWTDRLRDPRVWADRAALARLAAEADPAALTPTVLGVLAELMRRQQLDPIPFLAAGRLKHPADFELAFALGQCHMVARDGKQIGPFEAARALRPNNTTVLKNLGVALGQSGDWDGEVAACRELIRLAPNDAAAQNNLCVALREKGNLKGSLEAGEAAVRLAPEWAVPHDTLANTLVRMHDLNGAIREFREAVRLDPTFARAHSNLGAALKESGDLDGAIAAHRRAVEADRGYAIAHGNLGVALHIKGELDEALREFREAVRLAPRIAMGHYTLGLGLEDKGDLGGAIAAFRRAIELDRGFGEAHYRLGMIYHHLQNYPQAIDCARAALNTEPKSAAYNGLLGLALQKTGDTFGARTALARAAHLNPKKWGPVLEQVPPPDEAPPPREADRPD